MACGWTSALLPSRPCVCTAVSSTAGLPLPGRVLLRSTALSATRLVRLPRDQRTAECCQPPSGPRCATLARLCCASAAPGLQARQQALFGAQDVLKLSASCRSRSNGASTAVATAACRCRLPLPCPAAINTSPRRLLPSCRAGAPHSFSALRLSVLACSAAGTSSRQHTGLTAPKGLWPCQPLTELTLQQQAACSHGRLPGLQPRPKRPAGVLWELSQVRAGGGLDSRGYATVRAAQCAADHETQKCACHVILPHPASPRSNKWNQVVHFIFVPAIWWTVAGACFLDLWHFMLRASSGGMLLASTWVEFVA